MLKQIVIDIKKLLSEKASGDGFEFSWYEALCFQGLTIACGT